MEKPNFYIDSIENKVKKTSVSCDKFLEKFSNGAYTTLRVTKGYEIIFWEKHVRRLCYSFNSIIKISDFLKFEVISKRLMKLFVLCKPMLMNFGEAKVYIVIIPTKSKKEIIIKLQIAPMKIQNKDEVEIDFVKGSRVHFDKVKDIKWIDERKSIMKQKQEHCEEVVLLEDDGIVREGVSSNFFVILKNGSIMTSNEKILEGTMRATVLKICEKFKMKVVFGNPNWKNINEWKECFVSSTSRFAFPVRTIYYAGKVLKKFESLEVSKSIRKEVIKTVYSNNIKIE